MEKQKYDNKFVKCPFFVSDSANAIKCESAICKYQMYFFSSVSEKKKYSSRYCKAKYSDCKNFKDVNSKYEK